MRARRIKRDAVHALAVTWREGEARALALGDRLAPADWRVVRALASLLLSAGVPCAPFTVAQIAQAAQLAQRTASRSLHSLHSLGVVFIVARRESDDALWLGFPEPEPTSALPDDPSELRALFDALTAEHVPATFDGDTFTPPRPAAERISAISRRLNEQRERARAGRPDEAA
jgi:hypothetical protein